MKSKTRQTIVQDQDQLSDLFETNKTLANEKKELHREKLRVYSEKAVKLRCILRETTDEEQKRCIERKIKTLQEKQDVQIVKLTEINEIEKEIDHCISQQNDESVGKKSKYVRLSTKKGVEETPAQRLRTKSSMPYKTNYNEVFTEPVCDFSRQKGSFSKKSSTDQLLLQDSRPVFEELNSNKLAESVNHSLDKSKKSSKIRDENRKYSYCISEKEQFSSAHKIKGTKLNYNQNQTSHKKYYAGIPSQFEPFVEKVAKFWPQDIDMLVDYFQQCQKMKGKQAKRQAQSAFLQKKDERLKEKEDILKEQEQRLKKVEDKNKKIEQNIKSLIEKERDIMERVDKLERHEKIIQNKIQNSLISISNSQQLLSRSSILFKEHKHDSRNIHRGHQISFDSSFEDYQQPSGVQNKIAKFDKHLKQFLQNAEKDINNVSSQLKQMNSKLNKTKEEVYNIESKKKMIEQDIHKVDQTVGHRRGMMKELQTTMQQLQEQAAQSGATAEIKKNLAQELQQKCEKLKAKKKSHSQRVKKLEQDIEQLTQRKQELFKAVIDLQQNSVAMKTYEKELETKIIFYERDKQSREKDLKELEEKVDELMAKFKEASLNNQNIMLKISQQQIELSKICNNIQSKKDEEVVFGERARKLQQQLADSMKLLEEQTAMAQEQSQLVTMRSAEHLQMQSKIAQAKANLRQLEGQTVLMQEKLEEKTEEVKKQQESLFKMSEAKQQLSGLLGQIMNKKEELLAEIQERSKQFQVLLNDLESGQEDYINVSETLKQIKETIQSKSKQLSQLQAQCESMRNELDQELEEESNIVTRLGKLKEVERKILLGIGVKGGAAYLDEDLKERVAEAVGELSALSDIKNQLKECKYQNRKYKLENQKLTKLLEGE